MTEKPRYQTSTLAQIATASVACYLIGAIYLTFRTGDLAGLKWAAEIFGAGYLAARPRIDGKKEDPNGHPAPVVAPG